MSSIPDENIPQSHEPDHDTDTPEQIETTDPPKQPTSKSKGRRWRLSRRGFLIGAGATGVGLALGITFGVPYARLKIAESLDGPGGRPANTTTDPWAWFEVTPDNKVRLYLGKVEMGQGVHTALAQIAAEELGIGFENLEVRQATTAIGPLDTSGTSGSNSVSSIYTPLRTTAAVLREMLRIEAALVLQQPADSLILAGPAFYTTAGNAGDGETVTFQQLVETKHDWEIPEEEIPLKDFRAFEIIGQPLHRVDIPAKVTGSATYGYDVRLDGMKYGTILRPPTIEATRQSVSPATAAQAPGVHTVVTEDDFAGVVADSRNQARAAVSQLETKWDEGKLWQQEELDEIVTAGGRGGITIQDEGNPAPILNQSNTIVAEYRSPFAVQTPLEAQAALADVQPDHTRIWVSTQMQSMVQDVVSQALDIDAAQIEVIPTYLGGGFGRKSGFEVAVEAARLSKAAGIPVHVGWDRTEELRYGYFRPPTHHRLEAALADTGQIAAIQHHQASGDVAFDFLPKALALVMGADFGATRGARIHYAIPNIQTVAWRRPLPVRTGWWRGLGLLANTFAVESFMDEVAHVADIDPLRFRLNHLGDDPRSQRIRAVLEAVGEKSMWNTPPPSGRARGVACCIDVDTVVAQVAEISLDEATGKIRVHQVTAAMDCGLTVNPNGAKAQIEGNVMWGVGSTLIEEMQVHDG